MEEFWGERLSIELAAEIAASDDRVLDRFLDGWPGRNFKLAHLDEPPRLDRGQVRPVLGASWDLEREKRVAMTLLLYLPTVSVSADLIHLHWYLNTENFFPGDGQARMRRTLEWLANVRPLIM